MSDHAESTVVSAAAAAQAMQHVQALHLMLQAQQHHQHHQHQQQTQQQSQSSGRQRVAHHPHPPAAASHPLGASASAAVDEKKKRKRSNRKDKGLDAFRHALLQHLHQHARLEPAQLAAANSQLTPSVASPITPRDECKQGGGGDVESISASSPERGGGLHAVAAAAAAGASSAPVSESQRAAWLREYEARIADFSIKALVQESVRFRFPCSAFIILVPNWHALREALWLYLKEIGVKKAKRSVSTKKDLIDICIQPEVRFDFSEFVKDAESHGNRKAPGEKVEDVAPSTGVSVSRPPKKRAKKEQHASAAIKDEDESMLPASAADHEHEHEHELELDLDQLDNASTGGESASSMHAMQPSPPSNPMPAVAASAFPAVHPSQHTPFAQFGLNGLANATPAHAAPAHANGHGNGAVNGNGKPTYAYTPPLPIPSASSVPSHGRAPSLSSLHGPPLSHGHTVAAAAPIMLPIPAPGGPAVSTAQEVIHHFLNLSPAEYHHFKTWFYINVVQRENPGLHITVNSSANGPQQQHPPPQQQQHQPTHVPTTHAHQQHHQQQAPNAHHHQQSHHPQQPQQHQPQQPQQQMHHPLSPMTHRRSHSMAQQLLQAQGAMLHSQPSTPLLSSSLIPPMTPSAYAHGGGASDGTPGQQQQQHAGAVQAFHAWSNNVLMTPMMGPTGATPLLSGQVAGTPVATSATPSGPTPTAHLQSPSPAAGLFQSPALRGHETGGLHLANASIVASSSAIAAQYAAQQAAQASSHAAKLQQQLVHQQQQLEKLRASGGGEESEESDDDSSDDDDADTPPPKRPLLPGHNLTSAVPAHPHEFVSSPLMPPPPSHAQHPLSHVGLGHGGPSSSPLIKRTIINLANLAPGLYTMGSTGAIASPSLRALYRSTVPPNGPLSAAALAASSSSTAAAGMAALSQASPLLSAMHASASASSLQVVAEDPSHDGGGDPK